MLCHWLGFVALVAAVLTTAPAAADEAKALPKHVPVIQEKIQRGETHSQRRIAGLPPIELGRSASP